MTVRHTAALVLALALAMVAAACGDDPQREPDGLVAHYPLDGDAVDAVGQSSGVVSGATRVAGRRGDEGGALRFDGADDLVTFAHTDGLSLLADFTIAVWVDIDTPDDLDEFWTLFEKSDPERDGHSRYGLWLQGGRPWACFEAADNSQQPCVEADMSIGEGWHHVAAVRSGRRAIVYVDGVEVANAFVGLGEISQTEFDAFIGSDGYQRDPSWLTGAVDDLRIYDRGLSADEVADLASD